MTQNALPPLELSEAAIRELSLRPTATAAPEPEPDYTPLFDFPSGDVRIKVNCKGKEVIGNVVSQVMILASPVWSQFLFPPWIPEGAVGAGKEIDFREDNGEAILIILRIVHLQFCKVPVKLSLESLYHMALLCEQYDCPSSVKPWLERWMSIRPSKNSTMHEHPEWLYIAWAFGDSELFEGVAREITLNCERDLLYKSKKDKDLVVFLEKIVGKYKATLDWTPTMALSNN
jgi:hypothetical protein